MSLRLVWSKSLSGKRFSATLTRVKSFGSVCREIRLAAGLSQKEVAQRGDFEQARVSEVERGKYIPGFELGRRIAKGLGVSLTEIVARWEGLYGDGAVRLRGIRGPMPALDVPQEDLFRRVRGLWELMSAERRETYWKYGRSLVADQWKEETRGELSPVEKPPVQAARSDRVGTPVKALRRHRGRAG
jgi:transcriptional regulator with XRE-family HTH domain